MAKGITLVGGPADGKTMAVHESCTTVYVPVAAFLDVLLPDSVEMVVEPDTGAMTPEIKPLPLKRAEYKEGEHGMFVFQVMS